MNYREFQKTLKPLKAQGLANVKLSACEAVLRDEYERLVTAGLTSVGEDCQTSYPARLSVSSTVDSKSSELPVASNQQLSSCEEEIEPGTEIEAIVAESRTDDPKLAIATAAAYSVAGFAMVILWIALITTTLVISGLKCLYWYRQRLANLSLQIEYLEFPFGSPLPTQPLTT